MTVSSGVAPGWYIDPANDEAERYWNGSSFAPGARTKSPGTLPMPTPAPAAAPTEAQWRDAMLKVGMRQAEASERTATYVTALFWIWLASTAVAVALSAWAINR